MKNAKNTLITYLNVSYMKIKDASVTWLCFLSSMTFMTLLLVSYITIKAINSQDFFLGLCCWTYVYVNTKLAKKGIKWKAERTEDEYPSNSFFFQIFLLKTKVNGVQRPEVKSTELVRELQTQNIELSRSRVLKPAVARMRRWLLLLDF